MFAELNINALVLSGGQLLDRRQSGSNPANISKNPGCCGGQTGRNPRPTLLQFAEPDVAVADWVILILQG